MGDRIPIITCSHPRILGPKYYGEVVGWVCCGDIQWGLTSLSEDMRPGVVLFFYPQENSLDLSIA